MPKKSSARTGAAADAVYAAVWDQYFACLEAMLSMQEE